MRLGIKGLVAVIALLLWGGTALGADVAKIGVVDFQRVLKESRAGREAAEVLRTKQSERTSELGRLKTRIGSLQASLESLELSATTRDISEKRQELEKLMGVFKASDQKYSRLFQEINRRQTEKIRKELGGIIESLGRKGGYLLIVEKKEVLYAPASMDMTDRLIGLYDERYEKR
ncbi:OmpH family outer membrane protein [Desulfoluna sp.]|uniref:OmpH family outer membrane protein n=1 Tax=Desulfoluna sp. TaxID=2045199 RepID=UPI00261FCA43|nr:OmpH family outer membrane protein [Desulfoluna sp.]